MIDRIFDFLDDAWDDIVRNLVVELVVCMMFAATAWWGLNDALPTLDIQYDTTVSLVVVGRFIAKGTGA